MSYVIDREVAKKVVETVDAGLCSGLGNPVPGQMCVEAAVCFAMGMPHSDEPVCVGSAVRSFKINLNDRNWSSKEARAKGMRRVAVAQLGSDQIDQAEFVKELTLQTTKQILPIALRAAAKMVPKHAEPLEAAALACEELVTFAAVREVALSAKRAAANAAAYADYAANAAANAAACAANAANAAAYAADYAAAYAANAAAYAANAAYAAKSAVRDGILAKAAEIGVQVLIKLGSKGCEWLDLCD